MLFDATTTWNKQEWKVEVASQLMHENKVNDFIVVAIWNIQNLRHMICIQKPTNRFQKS